MFWDISRGVLYICEVLGSDIAYFRPDPSILLLLDYMYSTKKGGWFPGPLVLRLNVHANFSNPELHAAAINVLDIRFGKQFRSGWLAYMEVWARGILGFASLNGHGYM